MTIENNPDLSVVTSLTLTSNIKKMYEQKIGKVPDYNYYENLIYHIM